jgi:hypothetical protein
LAEPHQGIERVAVFAKRAWEEPVIKRVLRGGEQRAVEPDIARFVVHFILIARTLRNLDDHLYLHHASIRN